MKVSWLVTKVNIPDIARFPPGGQQNEVLAFTPFRNGRSGHPVNSVLFICLVYHVTLSVDDRKGKNMV